MNVNQPFKPGDKVIAPSISVIIKQNANEAKYVPATIVFAHPTNGWCSFRYEHTAVVATSFNDTIFSAEDYAKRIEENLKKAIDEFQEDPSFENEYVDGPSPDELAESEAEAKSDIDPEPGEEFDDDDNDDE